MMKKIIPYLSVLLVFSCSEPKKDTNSETDKVAVEELTFAQQVENAHKKEAFSDSPQIQFDFVLNFGGKEMINGTINLNTDSSAGLITLKNGEKLYYDKDKVYRTEGYPEQGARFHAYTWSYFFLFPYKLSDNGLNWTNMGAKPLDGKDYDVQKLTFEANVGDSPDDWYMVYAEDDFVVDAVGYIVTFRTAKEDAEKEPHAIRYLDYKEEGAVPLATKWTFHNYNIETGIEEDLLGDATLSNFQFLPDPLVVPEGLIEMEK